jgi:hypothetical protein
MAKLPSSLDGDEFLDRAGWHSIRATHRIRRRVAVDTLIVILNARRESSMVDKSMTGTFQINLPKDLVSESRRQPKPKKEELKVEGWRTSWLSRFSELLVGKD